MTWLPTTTRPAERQRVLVVSRKGVVLVAVYEQGRYTLDGAPFSLLRPLWWMPLPTPP